MSKIGIIYRATSPSKKVYVGKTEQTLQIRKRGHKSAAKKVDSKFSRVIKKYGMDGLRWEILHNDIPRDELCALEIAEIKSHNSFRRGYNSTPGGDGVTEHTAETRQKMSDAARGRKISDATKKRISLALMGRKVSAATRKKTSERVRAEWAEGKKTGHACSEETKKKMSEIHTGRVLTEKWKNRISVTRRENGIAFGEKNPMHGKSHSDDTRKKMRESGKGKHVGELNGRSKLTQVEVGEIRVLRSKQGMTYKQIRQLYNISNATVWRVVSGNGWKESAA